MRLTQKKAVFTVFILLACGAFVLWRIARSTDEQMRSELTNQAKIAAGALTVDRLASLSASEKDQEKPAYQQIKSQLASMRRASPNVKFLYLMGRSPDGKVYFYVDSLPETSEDYAPPGLIYDEVPEAYLAVFNTRQEAVVGPITDRWGTLMTALIPIPLPDPERRLAVLGMDVEAEKWDREIIERCIGPSLALLLMLLLIFVMTSRENILIELRKSEERLRNIVENTTNLFYSHTVDHELTYISPQSAEYLQCKPEEAMIRWTEFATKNPINEKGFKLTEKAIATGKRQKAYELELIGKRGKKIFVEVNETPILKNGKVAGIVGSLTDITERKRAAEALEKERDRLAKALAEVKTLRGILPICVICKKIRDDEGAWRKIEAYIEKHSEAEFSHSICRECAKKHYPNMNIYDD